MCCRKFYRIEEKMAKFGFGKKLAQLFGVHKNKNEDFFDDLTDTLIEGDIGAKTAFEIEQERKARNQAKKEQKKAKKPSKRTQRK